jgi:hypothetical protein
MQGSGGHPEHLRGTPLVPARADERLLDRQAFQRIQVEGG